MINIKKNTTWYISLMNMMNIFTYRKRPTKRYDRHKFLNSFYEGKWYFKDNTGLTRMVQITKELAITVDDYPLNVKIDKLSKQELLMTDHYGFHLGIFTKDGMPYKFYDETENMVYFLFSKKDSINKI
ncbi:DUF4828 domain-containing protein [Liquorilactobacillus mali]|uniref:DUF4828 domain-containing protein n=1 Tax=Liquorilactobacillus mali TaxID=1618 RepID=UPI0023501E7B|nr:DUF4828 domain-containing protein [Liquorilactobacillus mali]MDC7952829.1 DUF4828 domain-containing protein [Liquorilactobacillus mali]